MLHVCVQECASTYVSHIQFTQLLHKFASGYSHPLQRSFDKIMDMCRQGQVVVVCTY